MAENLKALIKRLNQSTLSVKKVGKKYRVVDTTQFDGNYGLMSARALRKNFS